jgi:hypothetical protein
MIPPSSTFVAVLLALVPAVHAGVPSWPATYQMNRSTIIQPCNDSGYFDPQFGGQFGIADFDWSNGKQLWVNAHPMDCEEMLIDQAALTKAANNNTHFFVCAYPNIALFHSMVDILQSINAACLQTATW